MLPGASGTSCRADSLCHSWFCPMCCGPGHPRTLEGTPTDLASSQGSPEMGPDARPRAAQSEPSAPKQETLILEDAQPGSPLATGTDQASPDEPLSSDTHSDDAGIGRRWGRVELLPGWPSAWVATGVPARPWQQLWQETILRGTARPGHELCRSPPCGGVSVSAGAFFSCVLPGLAQPVNEDA